MSDLFQEQGVDVSLEAIKQKERQLQKCEEQHQQQLMQVETVGIMTKYQLVFAKLEASLSKVSSILKRRNHLTKMSAFKDIEEKSMILGQKQGLQAKLLYRLLERNVGGMGNILTGIVRRNLSFAFSKIIRVNHLKRHEAQILQDHERFKKDFVVALNKKDAEISQIKRKTDENNGIVFALRNREIEIAAIIKAKDSTIHSLQRGIADSAIIAAAAVTTHSQSQQQQSQKANNAQQNVLIKSLEAKIAAAEHEQQELKEKQSQFSSNISMFVRDMSETMDGFEGSTMLIGSDNNVSLDEQSRSGHALLNHHAGGNQEDIFLHQPGMNSNIIQAPAQHFQQQQQQQQQYALTNKKSSVPSAPYIQQNQTRSQQSQQPQLQQLIGLSQQQQSQQQYMQYQQASSSAASTQPTANNSTIKQQQQFLQQQQQQPRRMQQQFHQQQPQHQMY